MIKRGWLTNSMRESYRCTSMSHRAIHTGHAFTYKGISKSVKNIIICCRSKYIVPPLTPLVPTYLLPVPSLNSIFRSGCSCATTHGPPLLSGFSFFLCVEQRAEQSNDAEAIDNSNTPQNGGQKYKNTGKSRGSGTAVSCGNPSNRWRKRWANSQSGGGRIQFSVGWNHSRHLLVHDGRRWQVSYRCRCCSRQRTKSLGCWVVLDFVPRLCRTDGESAERWWGGFTVGWWEMFVVQHSNPSRPPESLAVILQGHWEDMTGDKRHTNVTTP